MKNPSPVFSKNAFLRKIKKGHIIHNRCVKVEILIIPNVFLPNYFSLMQKAFPHTIHYSEKVVMSIQFLC